MIITRTPFRVSFAGGGSDIRDFYNQNGYGAVVSTAIKKYMYIILHPYFHNKIRIKYSKTEDVSQIEDIEHPIVRECLRKVKIDKGIEIASIADIPAGTGLGSSSAFTVGLLNALYAYNGKIVSKEKIAAEACEVEIELLKEPIGKQDQYASALGNINYLRFNRDETVEATPIFMTEYSKRELEKSLCLYYIGGSRRSYDILHEQINNISDEQILKKMKDMLTYAEELKDILQEGRIQQVGDILHKGWLHKKDLASGITNERIDSLYEIALKNGATGGKVLGAGGGGFLLIFAKDHEKLKKALPCEALPFQIDTEGTKIIFYE
jgi:D-glycero-alpha-D-manno-heptose-7-phosphate kinase